MTDNLSHDRDRLAAHATLAQVADSFSGKGWDHNRHTGGSEPTVWASVLSAASSTKSS
jgi:hypothetical protein